MKGGRGKFIVFEGIDGSGKSSLMREVACQRSLGGKDVLTTKEPTRMFSEISERIKPMNSEKEESQWFLSAFIADRNYHLAKVIAPSWGAGIEVLCKRYKYSTVAYQTAQGINCEEILSRSLNFPSPDIAFILNIPVEKAIERISAQGKGEGTFQKEEFLKKVGHMYSVMDDLFPHENIIFLDANLPVKQLASIVNKKIDDLYRKDTFPDRYDHPNKINVVPE